MRLFLRRSAVGREPLAVAMSGARMGERVLQIGLNDPAVAGTLAAKPGLSGESAIVVADDATAVKVRRAASEAGAPVEVRVHSLERLPYDDASFDLVVIHNREDLLSGPGPSQGAGTLAESRRVLRAGGRVVVLDRGAPSGLKALMRSRDTTGETSEGTIQRLQAAGFKGVRLLGDRDNYRFIEGMKIEERS